MGEFDEKDLDTVREIDSSFVQQQQLEEFGFEEALESQTCGAECGLSS